MKRKNFIHRILTTVMVLSLCLGAMSMMASASGAIDVTDGGHTTGGGAWANTDVKIYNSKVTMTFNASAQLEGGNWIDFALRGNEQEPDAWFAYSNGLVLRIYCDPTWGTYMKVGYGGGDVWFDDAYGESALKYTDVDWAQDHTISYSVYDVYENGTFIGVRVDVDLDGETVAFTDTSGGDGSFVWIPAATIEAAPAEHFAESYLFAWGNGKNLTVKAAYVETLELGPETDSTEPETDSTETETDSTEPETDSTETETDPIEPETDPTNATDGGHITGGGAWANTDVKLHNNIVRLTFNTSAQLESGNWIDFALRGNEQDPDAWFAHSNGLVLRIFKDPSWGTYMKVGYGGGDAWFDVAYGESNAKYDDVDWTQDHTISYSIYDVYENGIFMGIHIEVIFDGETVTFKDMNNAGYTSTSDGSYILIPASYLETAPAEHFIDSYLFVWGYNTTVTVKTASVEEIQMDSESGTDAPQTGDTSVLPMALAVFIAMLATIYVVTKMRKVQA